MVMKLILTRLVNSIALIVAVITGMVFVVAQGESLTVPDAVSGVFSAYIYNAAQGEMIFVSADGTHANYTLSLPDNVYVAGQDIAFTRDGHYAAYCMLNANALYEDSEASFVLRDIAQEQHLIKVNIGRAIACRVDPSALNEDETLAAVAVMNKIPDVEQITDDPRPASKLMIIDVVTGDMVYELDTDHPALKDLSVMQGPVMFYVRDFDADGVTFGLLPWFIGGPDTYKLFHWSPESGEITDAGVWQNAQVMFGDEIAFVGYDESLPYAVSEGPIPPANLVQVQKGHLNPKTVLIDTENIPLNVQFIKGGSSLGVLLLEGTPEPVTMPSNRVTLLEIQRDGDINRIGNYEGYLVYRGTAEGVAVLSQMNDDTSTQTEYYLTLIENSVASLLWHVETPFGSPVYELVWVTPMKEPETPFELFDSFN